MTLSRINHTGGAPSTTLNGSITAGATSLTLASATGYPSAPFVIKIDAGTASEEKVLVGARSGTSCTSLTRSYDGTNATSHSSGAAVEHDLAANVVDDLNDHVYTTSRDDHTQYLRVDGTRAGTGAQTIGGALTVSSGGITISAGGAQVTGNSKVTGTLEVTSSLTVDAGGLTVTAGGLTVSAGTTAVQALTATTISGTALTATTLVASSTAQATAHISTLTGTNGRYVGTTSGAPSSGTYLTNDFANDPTNGVIWQCTAGGTPGTWVQLGGPTDAAWTAATLTNSWVSTAGNFRAPGYRKVNAIVELRGSVKSGSFGAAAFTLPVGYRPSGQLEVAVPSGGAFGYVRVQADGSVIPEAGSAAVGVPVDNISFDTVA